MNLREAEKYLEKTLRVTQEMCQRHVERELSIDGLCKRLSQFADVLYLGVILATFPVGVYSIGKAISQDREQPSKSERYELPIKRPLTP